MLEKKILFQSQKMRQMASNAKQQQVERVNIYEGNRAIIDQVKS